MNPIVTWACHMKGWGVRHCRRWRVEGKRRDPPECEHVVWMEGRGRGDEQGGQIIWAMRSCSHAGLGRGHEGVDCGTEGSEARQTDEWKS